MVSGRVSLSMAVNKEEVETVFCCKQKYFVYSCPSRRKRGGVEYCELSRAEKSQWAMKGQMT